MRPNRWSSRWWGIRVVRGRSRALLAGVLLAGVLGCSGRVPLSALPTTIAPGTAAGTAAGTATQVVEAPAAAANAPAWVSGALQGSALWGLPDLDLQHETVALSAPEGSGTATSRADAEVVVVGTPGASELAQMRQIAVEAVRAVDSAWTRPWTQRLLIVAPADRSQWESVAGVSSTGAEKQTSSAHIDVPGGGTVTNQGDDEPVVAAAMTVAGADGGSYVIIDPTAWRAASEVGRRALVIHEAVHVAVRSGNPGDASTGSGAPASAAISSTAPLWLSEGFAQYVAYDAVGVEPRQIAGELLKRVGRDGAPQALPDEVALTGSGRQRLDSYALAWFACLTLADRAGPDAPRRAMEAGSATAAGVDDATLTRAWRDDLRRLARAGP